jgi:hypothetical protein
MQIVVGWDRLMIAVGVVSTMACASGVLGAQTIPSTASSTASSTSSSTAWVGGGLGVQNDASVSAGVQLSAIGALAALGFSHTLTSGYDFGVRASASFYPQAQENRVTLVGPSAEGVDPDGNLTVGIVAAELGPHRARGASWFGTAGAAFALATPRRYDRVAPMLGAGVIAPMTEHTAARVSFEWMARALGRTRFQIPLIVSYTTPF